MLMDKSKISRICFGFFLYVMFCSLIIVAVINSNIDALDGVGCPTCDGVNEEDCNANLTDQMCSQSDVSVYRSALYQQMFRSK